MASFGPSLAPLFTMQTKVLLCVALYTRHIYSTELGQLTTRARLVVRPISPFYLSLNLSPHFEENVLGAP